MKRIPRETGMRPDIQLIACALKIAGFDALWAKGKGGGFWIDGLGYKSPDEARAIAEAANLIKIAYRPHTVKTTSVSEAEMIARRAAYGDEIEDPRQDYQPDEPPLNLDDDGHSWRYDNYSDHI